MISVNSLRFFGLGVFWIIQLNPIYIYNMSKASGYGYGMIRAICYICGIGFLLLIVSYHHLLGKNNRRLSKQVFDSILPIMIFMIFSIFLNLFRNDFDIIGVFPLVEFIISALIFSIFDIKKWVECKFVTIMNLIVLFMLFDILFWIYSYGTDINYGVFRANINGVTINRMVDLFLVPAATYLLLADRFSLKVKLISIIFIGLTFYRTAYLAALVTFLFILLQKRDLLLTRCIKIFVFISLLLFFGYLFSLFSDSSTNLPRLIFERFVSTFTVESEEEWSQSGRINQIPVLFNHFANNPIDLIIGAGTGAVIDENKIYNYFNYPLIMLTIYGIFPALLFLFLLCNLFFKALKVGRGNKDVFVMSFLVYFFVIINIFPYMTYFPIMSVFAFCLVYFHQKSSEKVV